MIDFTLTQSYKPKREEMLVSISLERLHDSHQDAWNWGKQELEVWKMKGEEA